MMKYNLIRPCSECPFRSDFPKRFEGWLGHRAEKMAATVIIQSYTFACHKTVKRQDCDDEGEDICNDESEQSAELLSNLVYGIQAAFSVDCSSSCLPSLKMTLLTTKVNKLNP